MPNFATAVVMGHLGRDPETRYLPSGESVTNVSVATTRKRKDGETTTWWRGAVWGKRGEALAQYLKKGDPVLLTGEPFQREWTDQQGATRISLEMDVRDWAFASGKGDREQGGQPPSPQQRQQPQTANQAHMAAQAQDDFNPDADIPF